MRRLLLLCVVAAWAPSTATAGVVHLIPARDNTVFESALGDLSNGAGPALFAGNNGLGLPRRALLFFAVENHLAAGARIDSVVLVLRVSNAPNDIPRYFTFHRVLTAWGEGTSSTTGGAGAAASDLDATWLHTFYPSERWSRPGGDFDPAESAALPVAGVATYTVRGAGLTADVQSWLDQPGTNHGWMVLGEETGLNTARRLESREAGEPAARPTLAIYYTTTISTNSTTWGSIKARYR